MIKQRLKRGLAWLLMTLLVLGAVAGCGSQAPAASQSQAVTAGDGQAERTQEPAFGSAESEKGNHNQQPEKPEDSRNPETAEDADPDLDLDSYPDPYPDPDTPAVTEDGSYTTREEVALYLHTFGHLPGNYITKKEAEKLGWDNKKGNLWEVAPGKSIGGSHFGNYEKQLPEKKGRKYYECDINYEGKYRGAERIIYSDDGLVFYTGDHYKTFEQLYP